MKKYIVLGGNGFIGRNLCLFLNRMNCHVTSFDLKHENCTEGIEYITGDFFDEEILKMALEDADIIIHAIGTINPGNSTERYIEGYEKDFIQTIKMCSWIKDTEKTLVFLSSGGSVYGYHDLPMLAEDVLPRPINHYANIKLSIENALRIFHIQNKLNILIARISNPYGPGQDYTKGVGFIDAVLKRSLQNQVVEIWGDGSTIRDYIYIDDVCKIIYMLTKYQGNEYLFNIGSGVGVSQREIIEMVIKLGIPVSVSYKSARSVDVPKIILDNRRVKDIAEISLTPLETGVKKYLEYLLNG